jgi:predicted DNA-binding protein
VEVWQESKEEKDKEKGYTIMPRIEKEMLNYQVTSRMPKDLVDRIDRICQNTLQARGAWIRQTIVEKVREEEAKKTK